MRVQGSIPTSEGLQRSADWGVVEGGLPISQNWLQPWQKQLHRQLLLRRQIQLLCHYLQTLQRKKPQILCLEMSSCLMSIEQNHIHSLLIHSKKSSLKWDWIWLWKMVQKAKLWLKLLWQLREGDLALIVWFRTIWYNLYWLLCVSKAWLQHIIIWTQSAACEQASKGYMHWDRGRNQKFEHVGCLRAR